MVVVAGVVLRGVLVGGILICSDGLLYTGSLSSSILLTLKLDQSTVSFLLSSTLP